MTSVISTARLRDALRYRKKFMQIDDAATYKRCRVQLHAQGIVLRDIVQGEAIKTKRQQICRSGEFLVAEIDAKVGGFGIVPDDLDGAIVSSHYFLFDIDTSLLDRRFLGYYIRTRRFQEQVSAQGSTNYAAIRPDDVLSYSIPLPPLSEQRRIGARIEELAAKIEEARGLRREVADSSHGMLLGVYRKIVKDVPLMPMEHVAPLVRRPVQVKPDAQYYELGIRSFGKGTFHKPPIMGHELGSKRIFYIEPDDLLFNIVFAWEGAVAVATPQDRGRVGSHRFLTCVPVDSLATPSFLRFHFLTRQGLEDLGVASPGGAGRNRTLSMKGLTNIRAPIPSYDKQLWFDDLQHKVQQAERLREEVGTELDALLPSVLDKAFKGEL